MVTEPALLSVTVISIKHISCNEGINGAVNITVTGGVGAYNYSWSNGAIT